MRPARWAAVLAFGAAIAGADPSGRVAADRRAGRPLVAHVVVALCDNDHQGIVKIPRALGDGTSPRTNLYWGAQFGVKSYLTRARGWQPRKTAAGPAAGVLERVVVSTEIAAGKETTTLYVVADAWDGRRMNEAVRAFLEIASGRGTEPMRADGVAIEAGGAAHVVAFVGHNGLMDFTLPAAPVGAGEPARAAIVLACASAPYFADRLARAQADPLLLTRGLLAPEAYTLEAALRAFFSTGRAEDVHEAAAAAYDRFQHCGLRAARRLFAAPGVAP